MVKKFIDLNENEKSLVCEFLNGNSKSKKSFEDFQKEFVNEVYDYGNGILFYFENGVVLGKVNVVLESIEPTGASYIFHVDILEAVENKEIILKELIASGKTLSKEYGAKDVFFGMLNENTEKLAENIGINKSYSAFEMTLEDGQSCVDTLELTTLTEENIDEYVNLSNGAFNDIPHGGCINFDKAKRMLEELDKDKFAFIVSKESKNIGIMEINIENNKGFFDIGLIKEYRGRGYGKMLLETAIEFLKSKAAEKICLIVIEKNKIAFEMYKKRGFTISKVMSDWTKL